MIETRCPECQCLLKKKDLKNDKCWKCGLTPLVEKMDEEQKSYFEKEQQQGEIKIMSFNRNKNLSNIQQVITLFYFILAINLIQLGILILFAMDKLVINVINEEYLIFLDEN